MRAETAPELGKGALALGAFQVFGETRERRRHDLVVMQMLDAAARRDVEPQGVDQIDVGRRHAEIEAVEPEAIRATADETPNVLRTKAARKMLMLPGTIQMIAGVISSRIVSNPLPILMDVGCVGMPRLVPIY